MAKRKRKDHPNIREYYDKKKQRNVWKIYIRLQTPTGPERYREYGIPTFEQAEIRLAAVKKDAYEGRNFRIEKSSTLTVKDLWDDYLPTSQTKDSHASDLSRSAHLLRHLGTKVVMSLTQADVDAYKTAREKEPSPKTGEPPSPQSVKHELVLLKRVLNYAAKCRRIPSNPLASVALPRVSNVRQTVVQPQTFEEAISRIATRSRWMILPLTTAYDCGMRIGEILHLEWAQIDLTAGRLVLDPSQTKTESARIVYLSERVLDGLKDLRASPWHPSSPYVFAHPKTGKPRGIPRKGFARAFPAGIHVHDLRRSFVTQARKAKVPESVVMRMSGHKTRSVFDRYNIVDEEDLKDAQHALQAARGLVRAPQS